jgi:hypothetical protein
VPFDLCAGELWEFHGDSPPAPLRCVKIFAFIL